jgi:hypothetical protein
MEATLQRPAPASHPARVVARAGDETFEVAVHKGELTSVLQALQSGTGGGWRVPSTIQVSVVRGGDVTTYDVKRW